MLIQPQAEPGIVGGVLAPGDDDPRSPAQTSAGEAHGPLGPGDDDPRSPVRGVPEMTTGPLGPGDTPLGEAEDDDLVMLAPTPPGPGDAASGPRHVTHVPRRRPTVVPASAPAVLVEEDRPAQFTTFDAAQPAHEDTE